MADDDLISRSSLMETMFQNEPVERFHPQENKMWQECFGFIENAPAVDAVSVVRSWCKCGGVWVFCDKLCGDCPRANWTATNRTEG